MKYILMMNTMRVGHGVPDWHRNDLPIVDVNTPERAYALAARIPRRRDPKARL